MIKAARDFIAAGNPNVPVLEIARAADVGMGSFYNHFDTKEQLFQAALQDIFDRRGALLDGLPPPEDPAETFALRFRLIGRMFRRRPHESRVLLSVGLGPIVSDRGLTLRALRDIKTAHHAGRFHVDDPELALTLAVGALLSLNRLLHDQPQRDDAQATDCLVKNFCAFTAFPQTKPGKSAVGRFRTWITSPFTMSSVSKAAGPSHGPVFPTTSRIRRIGSTLSLRRIRNELATRCGFREGVGVGEWSAADFAGLVGGKTVHA